MKAIKFSAAALALLTLVACSSIEYEVWEPGQFAAGNYQTYSWRSEPIVNTVGSPDLIYKIDPIVRSEMDRILQAKGFEKIVRNGDFTVDYIYAPGVRAGVAGEATTNVSPRAGVRPNTSISGAERDNAIALSGARATHNLGMQLNDGKTGMEVWRGVLTEIARDMRVEDVKTARRTIRNALSQLTKTLPERR